MRYLLPMLLVLTVAGCATSEPEPTPLTACNSPRPQVCTMQYLPVCAELKTGERKTYSSDCNACADDQVVGHSAEACPDDKTSQ